MGADAVYEDRQEEGLFVMCGCGCVCMLRRCWWPAKESFVHDTHDAMYETVSGSKHLGA